ncbi:MAG: protease modulator HflC [Kiritimatiellaeota bacterium]|nr:protease modulator HflC [Kiritimatiellota bacterium]
MHDPNHSHPRLLHRHTVRALVLLALGAVLAWRCLVAVDETQFAIVTQFGRYLETLEQAGPHLILPWQSVRRFDRRLQLYDPRGSEFLTSDPKNILLDVYVCWRITDPLRFLQRLTDRTGAEARLHDIVWSDLAAEVGRHPLSDLISDKPGEMKSAELMRKVRADVMARVEAGDFGIEVVDVRLKRVNFPRQNKQSVFDRMRAERDRIARLYRAQGEEEALKIRADADFEKSRLLAEAERDAELKRGEAEKEAIRIYTAAHARDPEFYRFLRYLEVYRNVLTEKTTLVLSADSEIFRYLGSLSGVDAVSGKRPRTSAPGRTAQESGHETGK